MEAVPPRTLRQPLVSIQDEVVASSEAQVPHRVKVRYMADIDVVIADNQPLSLSGIRSAVASEADIRILAECENSERLLDAVRHYAPHVLLVSVEILRE